ncbi:protein madd-4-like isoform X2 [Ornithodoros turicata]|uniref:protein madd-4-like isoform X2 n=1 Tax=Ornithodoros turicata TaxID=34597 RepID=UPI00313A431B
MAPPYNSVFPLPSAIGRAALLSELLDEYRFYSVPAGVVNQAVVSNYSVCVCACSAGTLLGGTTGPCRNERLDTKANLLAMWRYRNHLKATVLWTLWVLQVHTANTFGDDLFVADDSSRVEEVDEDGWSRWSLWSTCSRTCDGGVSMQLRQCLRRSGCQGEPARYRICNMQPCPEVSDFRAAQCAAYNSVPYRGRLYEWTPFHDPSDPCSLTCQAKEFRFMAKLAPRTQDGTRCRDGALDMCVQGRCMPVGCDLKLGSSAEVDECGVCGGNGTLCKTPAFIWAETPFSTCSVTCGGGTQESHPVCTSSDTGEEVDGRLCSVESKPDPRVRGCNTNPCPPSWHLTSWSECSASCGGGRQHRNVSCVRPSERSQEPVQDHFCPGQRPPDSRTCNTQECSRWTEGQWSQTRVVECRDARGRKSSLCDPGHKPRSRQPCSAADPCFAKGSKKKRLRNLRIEEDGSQEDAPPQSVVPRNFFARPQRQSPEPSFIVGDWGSCSVTCGEGIQKRKVECKIFLEFSRTMAELPDKECAGIRPAEIQRCSLRPCALDQNREQLADTEQREEVSYSWRNAGFTPCSASCLGGIRESLVQCMQDQDESVVSYLLCDIRKKPETITQTCNNHPCPPRWNVSEFGVCTKACGGGTQTRSVQCVHEVTRGPGNTLVVSDDHCPRPRPVDKQACNIFDCTARWVAEKWNKCSKICDGGVKTRKIRCQRQLSYGNVVEVSPSQCLRRKPKTVKACNTKPCRGTKIQNGQGVQGGPHLKASITARGKAAVFLGTTLKMRCPGAHAAINGSGIEWAKDGAVLKITGHRIAISRKGALRIRRLAPSDAGTYSCTLGSTKSDLVLTVKELPPDFDGLIEEEDDGKGSRGHKASPTLATLDVDHRKPHKFGKPLSPTSTVPKHKNKFPFLTNSVEDTQDKDDSKPWDESATSSWQRKHGLVSDQESEDIGIVRGTLDDPTVRSGASSSHEGGLSRIQTMLTKFHRTFGGGDGELPPEDEDMGSSDSYVLGKGSAESLTFEWSTTPWSACSQTCGGNGLQVRATQCMVRLHNVSRTVDNSLCVDAGLETPQMLEKCGLPECPQWATGPWSQCSERACFTLNTSTQEREVSCRLPNASTVEPSWCSASSKPMTQQRCFSDRCIGVWKAGEWSECTATCGEKGFRTRILQCVWFGTDKPAGNSCLHQSRPEVLQTCTAPPCSNSENTCEDHSRNCHMLPTFHMCHMKNYHDLCCATCEQS